MSDQQEDPRFANLQNLRSKAFDIGGSLGNVLTKSFELITRVVQVGIEDEETITFALESLANERHLARRRDPNPDHLYETVYGFSDSVAYMLESLLAQRRGGQVIAPPPPQQRVSPTDSDNTLPLLFSNVKEEPAEEQPRIEVITLDDGPSTSAQTPARTKKQLIQPVTPIAGPSTSQQVTPRVQKTSTPLPAATPVVRSAIRESSIFKTPTMPRPSVSTETSVASAQRVRFNDTVTTCDMSSPKSEPSSSKRVRLDSIASDTKPAFRMPVSSLDLLAASSNGSGPAKRRRTFVDYGEDHNTDHWEDRRTPVRATSVARGTSGAFECDQCEKAFNTNQGLARHMLVHDGIKCTLCHYRMGAHALEKHMATKHRHVRARSQPVVSFSNTSSSSRASLPRSTDLEEEEVDVEGVEVDQGGAAEGSWVCDRCDRVFDHKAGLTRHLVVHTGSQCQVCKKFMSRELYDSHMSRLHGALKPILPSTPKTVIVSNPLQANDFERHYGAYSDEEYDDEWEAEAEEDEEYRPTGRPRSRARSMSVGRPRVRAASVAAPGEHACDQCDKSFGTPRGLKKHKNVHRTDDDIRSRFVCDQCPVTRLSNAMLNHHKREAHGVNPYACTCGASFAMKALLMAHRERTGHTRSPNSRKSVQPESPVVARNERAGTAYM